MTYTIGVDDLDERDLTVVRSVVKLRSETWSWVDAPSKADVWLVDMTRSLRATPLASLALRQVIRLVAEETPAVDPGESGLILKPVKAARLIRLIDNAIEGKAPRANAGGAPAPSVQSAPAAQPAAAAPDAQADGHPWRGRKVRFQRSPNLARYPVTAEMLGLVEKLTQTAIAYDAIAKALPMDMKLFDEILGDASREGYLVDENGMMYPPQAKPQKKGFRLFG